MSQLPRLWHCYLLHTAIGSILSEAKKAVSAQHGNEQRFEQYVHY